MKTFDFSAIEFNESKAEPQLEHIYYPFDDDRDIYVECSYMTNADTHKYIKFFDGETSINYEAIIKDKVKSISGITAVFKDKEVDVTKNMLLSLPMNGTISALISKIVSHLMDSNALSEDEEKNFD